MYLFAYLLIDLCIYSFILINLFQSVYLFLFIIYLHIIYFM